MSRTRTGAPVAVPVTWGELERLKAANTFRMADMDARLKALCPALDQQKNLQSLTDGVIGKLQDWANQT